MMRTCDIKHAVLVLLFIRQTLSLPTWFSFSEEFGTPGASESADEAIIALQMHDPLENRGVALVEGLLVEGDIRRRPDQPLRARLPIAPQAVAGYSKGGSAHEFATPSHLLSDHQLRNAKPYRDEIWTDRVIPYVIDGDFNITERARIHQAITEIEEGASHCISFVPRTHEMDFVYITGKMGGCFSDIGRQGGNQTLSVDSSKGCVKKGIIMHELMHTLGFWHEHTRYDRNSYITILFNNIVYNHQSDFYIQEGNLQNLSYDYYSIMHYSTTMFSRNRSLKTIDILNTSIVEEEVGQRKYLSDKDIKRIKALYECPITKCAYPKTFNDESVQVVNITVGSRVVYSCTSTNLVLVGATERTCLFDGTWSGSPPLCFSQTSAPSHCDFEGPFLCGWTQDITDDADWTRICSHTESQNTGPLVDHTKQTSEGYYMYLEGGHLLPNSSARLLSPTLQAEPDICILFWYNMYGAGMGTMKVKIQFEDGNTQQLWSLSGNQNFGWKMDLIAHLNPVGPYKIIFEAIRGPLDTTDMAIDDVMIGACHDIASYQNAVIREHKEGSYLYIETSNRNLHDGVAWIYSPMLTGNGVTCITFNYHMYGTDVGNITAFTKTSNAVQQLWSASGDHGDVWLTAQAQVYVIEPFQIAMAADQGVGFRGDIAFDNIEVLADKCPTVLHCDFDAQTLCDLHNDRYTDDFDWSVAHGNDIFSPSTGPRTDHTKTSGNFVYIESSSPRSKGDIARLLTPYLPANDFGYCVSFWYYMYGQDVATLRLIVRRDDGSKEVVWFKHGDHGQHWLLASVTVKRFNFSLQLIFEGEVGASYKSDIALDDIAIIEGPCI